MPPQNVCSRSQNQEPAYTQSIYQFLVRYGKEVKVPVKNVVDILKDGSGYTDPSSVRTQNSAQRIIYRMEGSRSVPE